MLRVGLTGGIGAGKSAVSRRLGLLGAVVVDADAIAREVVEPGTEGLAEVVAAFGDGVLRPDGQLDRPRLGDVVFGDAGARQKLNAIIHPRVGQRMAELDRLAGADAVVVHDVPLIAENARSGAYDLVVVVDAPPQTQIERLTRDRGMTREQAEARMAAQASREQRLAIADIVIGNSGSLADLDRQVTALWDTLRSWQAEPGPGPETRQ